MAQASRLLHRRVTPGSMEDLAKHPRLMKRGAVYWFRAKVPANLLSYYAPKREITFSLKTKDFKAAVERLRVESVRLDQEFAVATAKLQAAPRNTISDTEIERLAALHYQMRLEEDDEFRAFGSGDQKVLRGVELQAGDRASSPWTPEQITAEFGLSDREFQKALEATESVLEEQRLRLGRADTSLVLDLVDDLLDQNAIKLAPKSPEYRKLSLAVLKADVRALEAIVARNHGQVIETPVLTPAMDRAQGGASLSPSLSKVFLEWKAQHKGPEKTAQTFQVAVERFVSMHGDKPVGAITKSDIRSFRDAMLQYPAVLAKPQRGMSVSALLQSLEATPSVKRLSPKTVNEKYLAALSAILSLAMNEAGYIETNPCSGIRAKLDSQKQRPLYTDSDIATILGFPIFVADERPKGGAGEAAKWLPLLGMFTGARLEEIARLTVGDVQTEQGIAYIFIREGADGRRVKNRASVRKVPVHSMLERYGFRNFVSSFGKSEDNRLFPLVNSAGEQASSAWSKWWGRYARTHGITDQDKVFHSFRHTVKRKLRDAKVDKTVRDAITGHAAGDVAETYGLDEEGMGISLPILAEGIEAISYPCFKNLEKCLRADE